MAGTGLVFRLSGGAQSSPSGTRPHPLLTESRFARHAQEDRFTGRRPRRRRQIGEDGAFGPQTEVAIRFFQSVMFVPKDVDGIVGPDTGYALLWYGDPYYGYDDKVTNAGYCNEYLPGVV
ncbi:peptidoglycan-binding domain-containing protein [Streptomyces vinaceus]|uniref:peptidoglycan-binding domain-containing protein n=1 Tax=Streptomyces vinaceus TaxID=1960 RepID=UPI003696E946